MFISCTDRPALQVCLGASLGITNPQGLAWFKPDMFTYSLGFLMLSMGLTLTVEDFKMVRRHLARGHSVQACPAWMTDDSAFQD